jgi:hypothetical protein
MATILQFQKRLQRISNPKYLELVVFTEIKRHEALFVEAQKEQLNKGENFRGKVFGTYSPATEEIAKGENTRQPKIAGEPYNFEYYGDFFDGMYLAVFEDNALFFSDDPKTRFLITKYKDLFGLQPESLSKLIKTTILPAFLREIRKQLQL